MVYSFFLLFSRTVTLGFASSGFYLHLFFFVTVTVFYVIALITKKYMPYSVYLLSILFFLATGLFTTTDLGLLSPVSGFYQALVVVSMFLVGFKFCTVIFLLSNFVYVCAWFELPKLFNLPFNELMYGGDSYFYFSRIGSLTFIYASLVFFNNLRRSQREMLVKLALFHQESEKHSVSKQIIAGFAHEINNPLAIIKASVDQLERQPDRKQNFARISKAISRMVLIISTLLDSIDDKKISDEDINISNVLIKVISNFKKKSFKIEPEIITDIDVSLKIKVVEISLNKVLTEIIKNAYEAIDEKKITSPRIYIKLYKNGDTLVFECIDNADLLEDKTTDRCSTLFFTTKFDKPARGVGLYLVSSICQKQYWHFDIYSSDNHTNAVLTIPLNNDLIV